MPQYCIHVKNFLRLEFGTVPGQKHTYQKESSIILTNSVYFYYSSYTKESIMNAPPDDLPDCMVFWLAKAYQKAHGKFKTRLKPYGLTNLQHLVLEALWYRQGMTATLLSRMLTLDKATLSGILDRMAKAEWIVKKPSRTDKRQLSVYTSAKADALKSRLINERKKANENLLADFSIEERLLLKRFLIDIAHTTETESIKTG